MDEKREHIYYFDYLRLFAAAGVVYMHSAFAGLRSGVLTQPPYVTRGWHLLDLFTSLAFSAVPLFFMISGYLLLSDPKTQRVDILLRHRIPRLAIPLASWTVLTALWLCLQQDQDALPAFFSLLRGALYAPILMPLWFMYTLIALYLLSPFLYGGVHGLNAGGRRLTLWLIALVSLKAMLRALLPPAAETFVDLNIFSQLQALGGNLLLMLLGYYLGSWKKDLPNALLAGTAAGTFLVIVLGTWLRTAAQGRYDQAFQTQSAGFEVLLASCLFLLAKQTLNRPSALLRAIPIVPLSMPVYLMHGLLLRIFGKHNIDPLRFPGVLRLTIAVFVLSVLIAKTLASIRPLCYLFTGLRYETACRSCNWLYTFRRLKRRRRI